MVHGIGGIDVGVGRFVSHDVALSLRMSGITGLDGGSAYLGMIGPHVQAWLAPQMWLGAGLGVGFIAGCADTCDSQWLSAGFDARVGAVFAQTTSGSGNLALEATTFTNMGNSVTSFALLLGYQSF